MTNEQMTYFVSGYIYAQAEETVRSEFPSFSDSMKRKEIFLVYKKTISLLIEDLEKEKDSELRFVEDVKTLQLAERYEDIVPVIADIVIDTKENILAGMEFTHKLATSDRNAEIEKLRKENEVLRKENKKLSKGKGR